LLIVDDDPPIVTALRKIGEAEGFTVDAFTDPRDAVAALKGPTRYPVVCTDYMMAHLNGVDVLTAAREALPDGSRLLLTAANDFRVAVDAVNRGEVFRIVPKPWSHADLVSTLRAASEAYRLRVENRELTELVQAQNRELHALNANLEGLVVERTSNLLDALIAALDYRDAETQWHSRRVSRFTARLAQSLGITGVELRNIEIGALLHDIGKIAVSDRILLKQGPLDPDEWEEMRKHPEAGWRMLQRIPYLHDASQIVLQHQERHDGTGYPQRLKGREICIGARLFTVADTFDAITSNRPYRKAAPYELARAEIERCAGRQFDPEVVEIFCRVPPEDWLKIREGIDLEARDEEARGVANLRRPA
jgi:putative nucleotidyltransferase with HDIG domain